MNLKFLAITSAAVIIVGCTSSPTGTGTSETTIGNNTTTTSETSDDGSTGEGTTTVNTGMSSSGGAAETGADCLEGNPFAEARLAQDIEFLASDALAGRSPGTPGDLATQEFIADRFNCIGLLPADPEGTFLQPFTTSDADETANVVGYIEGTDLASEIVVVGAHHDHLGEIGGEIHHGANDNASGVAAILAVAHALQHRSTPPRRTIVFIAFGFEEHDGPCEGSEYYVDNAPTALPIGQVVYMVDGDMLGTYPDGGPTAYGSLPGTPARSILEDLLPSYPSLDDIYLGESAGQDDSDFQAFCDFGIPYIYLETWDFACYHEACDDASRIDYPSLSTVATLLGDITQTLADSPMDLAGATQDGCG